MGVETHVHATPDLTIVEKFYRGYLGLQATRRLWTMAIAWGTIFDAVKLPQSTCLLKQLIMRLGYIEYVSVKRIHIQILIYLNFVEF